MNNIHYSFGGNQDFYSFVVSALISETAKEEKDVLIDYRINNKYIADVYLSEGLSVLGRQYNPPFVVEINKTYNHEKIYRIIDALNNIGFKGTLFHISQDSWITNPVDSNGFETILLGPEFLNLLRKRNPDAYLNHILGNPKTSLREEMVPRLKSGEERRYLFLTEGENEELLIRREDPDKINAINEKEFIAHLNQDSEKSNCAIIIGNGVSIPFGSDDWFTMIKNLVDRLEPFHIEKRDHVESALSNSSYALSSFVKTTLIREENYDKYIEAIRYCIYRKYNDIMHDQPSLVDAIAKSKEKYKNLPLLTYNFDTFVERQYYHNTRRLLNYYTGNTRDENVDLIGRDNVIHLHGYISYERNKYNEIVLTDEDYFNAYLSGKSWTYKIQVKVLKEYACLFVGSSMSDLFQMSVIQRAKHGNRDKKWKCYALMCFKGLEFKEKMQIIKYYKEKGIQIIFVDDYDKLPMKLMQLFKVSY